MPSAVLSQVAKLTTFETAFSMLVTEYLYHGIYHSLWSETGNEGRDDHIRSHGHLDMDDPIRSKGEVGVYLLLHVHHSPKVGKETGDEVPGDVGVSIGQPHLEEIVLGGPTIY